MISTSLVLKARSWGPNPDLVFPLSLEGSASFRWSEHDQGYLCKQRIADHMGGIFEIRFDERTSTRVTLNIPFVSHRGLFVADFQLHRAEELYYLGWVLYVLEHAHSWKVDPDTLRIELLQETHSVL